MEGTLFTKQDVDKLLAEDPRCLVVPEGVTGFAQVNFDKNSTVEEIHLPKSITAFGMTFNNTEKLTLVEYAGTVAEWEKVTERNQYNLLTTLVKTVKCSDGEWNVPLLYFGPAYSGKKLLRMCAKFAESVEIPDDIEVIEGDAFVDCKKIKSLKIPASVQTINGKSFSGGGGFEGMESLEEIEIPATVTEFRGVFAGCNSLKTVRMKFTQKDLLSTTFTFNKKVGVEKTQTGYRDLRKLISCPALETVELPVVEDISHCLKDLPSLKTVIFPDELGSINPIDILSLPESAEIVVSDNAKIGHSFIEENGKRLAEVVFVKKTGRLLAVRTKETKLTLPDGIKQIEPNCFPPCVIELEMPKTLKKIKLPKKFPWGAYEEIPQCSKNVLAFLENFDINSTAAMKEKAKKEKIATVQAAGAAGLALSELQGLDAEDKAVTKPRVGSMLTIKLPFNYSIEFFFPKKQKPEEQTALESLFSVLKASCGDKTEEKLTYLENVVNDLNKNKDILQGNVKYGELDDEVLKCLLQRKIEGTGGILNIEDSMIKLCFQNRFYLAINKKGFYLRDLICVDSPFDELIAVAKAAAKAKSAKEIVTVVQTCNFNVWKNFFVVDNGQWGKGE